MDLRHTLAAFAVSACLVSAPAGAALLTATAITENTDSFTIEFDDSNGNGLFDLAELTSFSGATDFFSGSVAAEVLSVPNIPGFAVAGARAGATLCCEDSFWNFEVAGFLDNQWDLAMPARFWAYSITSVPEPATLPLLSLGLFAFASIRARRR